MREVVGHGASLRNPGLAETVEEPFQILVPNAGRRGSGRCSRLIRLMRRYGVGLEAAEFCGFGGVADQIMAIFLSLFGGLENRCTRERTVGSNPTPSS